MATARTTIEEHRA